MDVHFFFVVVVVDDVFNKYYSYYYFHSFKKIICKRGENEKRKKKRTLAVDVRTRHGSNAVLDDVIRRMNGYITLEEKYLINSVLLL